MRQPATVLLLGGMLLSSLQEVWCSSSPAILTDSNFKPTLETGDLWLVEFYAVGDIYEPPSPQSPTAPELHLHDPADLCFCSVVGRLMLALVWALQAAE